MNALGQLTLTVAANPADYSRFTTYQKLSSRPGPADINHNLGTASSTRTQLNFNDKFTTAGTPRLGFLQLVFAASSSRLDANGQLTTGIATQGLPTGQTEFTCAMTNSGMPCIFTQRPSNLLPFELGTTFYLQALGGGLATATQGISGYGSLSTDYQFRFLEADGETPVKVSEMPEPGSFALVGLLVLGALGAWKRKKRAAAELTK